MSGDYSGLMALLPASLYQWKACDLGREMHESWLPLSPWLLENGITLFKLVTITCGPPDGVKRGREPGVYSVMEEEVWNGDKIQQASALIHPARDSTGRWVLLRAVRLGTEGTQHRDILRFLSSYPYRADSRNHCLPIIRELELPDLTIHVMPLMSKDGIDYPWFFSLAEVLDLIIQTAEGLAFLHDNLMVHRDIWRGNLVINLAGRRPFKTGGEYVLMPWRFSFPIRYFYIDFEFAIRFDPSTQESPYLVEGPPSKFYQRNSAPEVYGSIPYDPFAADVFALGLMYWRLFQQVTEPGFLPLVEAMLVQEPSKRPKAAEVLCSFHAYREGLTAQSLYQPVPNQLHIGSNTTHPNAAQRDFEA